METVQELGRGDIDRNYDGKGYSKSKFDFGYFKVMFFISRTAVEDMG